MKHTIVIDCPPEILMGLHLDASFSNAANAMREWGIYFHVELVKRISARIGEAF